MIAEGPLQGVAVLGVVSEIGDTRWVGTGFHLIASADGTGDTESSFVVLATNRHVVNALRAELQRNPTSTAVVGVESAAHLAPEVFDIDVEGDAVALHPDDTVDVAVVFAPLQVAGEIAGVAPVPWDYQLTLAQLSEHGIGEGDSVYVLGFPLNVVDDISHAAVVRHGCIARMRAAHAASDCRYIIDSGVYPGNSGGPVYVRAEIEGTGCLALAGIVCSYLPYEDVAVSAQTGAPRVVFQENSGLAVVHTVDAIRETVDYLVAQAPDEVKEYFGAYRTDDEPSEE